MKPRVLMIAYACDPDGAGEHWLGWGWAEQAAKNFAVTLIATPKARTAIERESARCGIEPHFVAAPAWTKIFGAGNWLRKIAWQSRVLALAKKLHAQNPFALVHQTTFHTFRVPFLATKIGLPSVWGPIAGGEKMPRGFESDLGSVRWAENFRALANQLWLRFPPVKKSLENAAAIFVSNRSTLEFFPENIRAKSRIVPPNALRETEERMLVEPLCQRTALEDFRLLFVGNCAPTRAMPVVFDALVASKIENWKLAIVGDGAALDDWKNRARRLGISERVEFAGKVPHSDLAFFFQNADVFVFPALRDSGGSALMDAMTRGVPIVCFDWAGPGEMIDEKSGMKIPVRSREETVRALAVALRRLRDQPALRGELAAAARAGAKIFSWKMKREILEITYARLLRRDALV